MKGTTSALPRCPERLGLKSPLPLQAVNFQSSPSGFKLPTLYPEEHLLSWTPAKSSDVEQRRAPGDIMMQERWRLYNNLPAP